MLFHFDALAQREPTPGKLPPVPETDIYSISNADNIDKNIQSVLTAHPIVVQQISKVNFFGRPVVFLPILMNDPHYPIKSIKMELANPAKWWSDGGRINDPPGRPSLVLMEEHSSTLFAVLLDLSNSFDEKVGLGFVVVKRLTKNQYEIIVEDINKTILFAARVNMEIMDNALGVGRFTPHHAQTETRSAHNPKWSFKPEAFFMISNSESNNN